MLIPENIKLLILKWRNGTLKPDERQELDRWYNASMPDQISITDDRSEEEYRQAMLDRIHSKIGKGEIPVRPLIPAWLKIAAVILLMATASMLTYRSFIKSNETTDLQIAASVPAHIERIVLPDSSIVWLKGKSKLTYPKVFAKGYRQIELEGEALFEVSHHDHWPFKVRSGNFTTTVLGTSFNIRTGKRDQDFQLDVLTGRVQVAQRKAGKADGVYYINANQVFRAATSVVGAVPTDQKQAQRELLTTGTTYDMDFEKVPFEAIMHQFSQKFDIEFEGYTGEYKACTVTADLTGLPLEKALKILCLSVNATYKINGNKIKLTGGGCF